MTQNQIPPTAVIKPHPITTHDHTRTDNYYWLREKENPAVIAHLEAENAYMQAMTAHTTDLQQTLYEEMVGRIQETDSSAPVKHGELLLLHPHRSRTAVQNPLPQTRQPRRA